MTSSVYPPVGVTERPSLIRVLELYPGPPGTPFKGSLVVCCLDDDDRLPYTALSYTWGAQGAGDTTIQLQGDMKPVPVRANLKHALDTLRSPTDSIRLWIDALCINQTDPSDKNRQLPLMGRIYARASKTVIWLGPASDDSPLGMELVRSIGDERRRRDAIPSQAWLEATFVPAHWAAVGALMARQWWSRIWIVQEVLLSRNSQVCCGAAVVSWDDFVALQEVQDTHTVAFGGMRHIPRYPLSEILSNWSVNVRDAGSDTCRMFDWLRVTKRFAFTTPRDRFYALLAITNPGTRRGVEVQYDETQMSDAMVNVKVAIQCLMELQMLLPLQFTYNENRPPGLPSWCPNWYQDNFRYQSLAFEDREDRLAYRACGPYHTQARIDYHGAPLTNHTAATCHLRLRGWPFDAIVWHDAFPDFDMAHETTPAPHGVHREGARRRALHAKCAAWRAAVEARLATDQPNPYGTVAGLRAAFWRTLIADRNQRWAGPPSADSEKGLEDFLAGDGGPHAMSYRVSAQLRLARRGFMVTRRGFLGLAPANARVGDGVVVLEGGTVPFILRPEEHAAARGGGGEDAPRYTWVGEAYVHGIMQGEWVTELEEKQGESPELEDFIIT